MKNRVRLGLILGTGLLTLAPNVLAEEELPYLARVTVEHSLHAVAELGDSIQSVLHVDDAKSAALALAETDGVEVTEVGDGSIRIITVRKPTFSGQPSDEHARSSFVVDYSEAAVQTLNKDLRSRYERTPSVDEIVAYVYEHIDDKTYTRAFDFASRVASSGEGDCTEHAVLLAALARANGYFARVTIGTLLINSESEIRAFGHAWTEIHSDSGWQIKDATMPEVAVDAMNIRYLPISPILDEGPGYSYAMMQMLYRMPSKITGIENSG